jgi:hypothetical protein
VKPTLEDPDTGVIRLSPLVGSVERKTVPDWVREVMAGRAAVRPSLFELAPGRMIPGTRYRVMRWIADGGMGVVYEALDTELGREVALKVLRAEYCERPLLAEQFREEARAVSRSRRRAAQQGRTALDDPRTRVSRRLQRMPTRTGVRTSGHAACGLAHTGRPGRSPMSDLASQAR